LAGVRSAEPFWKGLNSSTSGYQKYFWSPNLCFASTVFYTCSQSETKDLVRWFMGRYSVWSPHDFLPKNGSRGGPYPFERQQMRSWSHTVTISQTRTNTFRRRYHFWIYPYDPCIVRGGFL
jgi:hypothetical protein